MNAPKGPSKLTGQATGRPYLRFDGIEAGIGQSKSGDRSNEFCYALICGCGAFLGILGVFVKNSAGQRTPYCPVCKHVTVVASDGQITNHQPYDITQNPAPRSS